MANLRKEKTGLPFIVFISQGGAQHDVRVKVAPGPKVQPSEMSSYSLRPFRLREGAGLGSTEHDLLRAWIDKNLRVLVDYGDGVIEYTEDVLERIERV